jgi:hypothetical protein
MTEERKHAILFAATLLCARKIIDSMDSDKPNLAKQFFIDRAIQAGGKGHPPVEQKAPTLNYM